jgi:hypothetical protein
MKELNMKLGMQKLFVLPIFALLAIGSSSPKKDDNGTTQTTSATTASAKIVGSCMQKTGGTCFEYYEAGILGEARLKSGCETMLNGVYQSAVACATNDTLIGVCTQTGPQISPDVKPNLRQKMYYYDEGANKSLPAARVGDGCKVISGTFAENPSFVKKASAAKKK